MFAANSQFGNWRVFVGSDRKAGFTFCWIAMFPTANKAGMPFVSCVLAKLVRVRFACREVDCETGRRNLTWNVDGSQIRTQSLWYFRYYHQGRHVVIEKKRSQIVWWRECRLGDLQCTSLRVVWNGIEGIGRSFKLDGIAKFDGVFLWKAKRKSKLQMGGREDFGWGHWFLFRV